jgi:hypothetical protein
VYFNVYICEEKTERQPILGGMVAGLLLVQIALKFVMNGILIC